MKTNKLIVAITSATALVLSSCYYHNWENIHPGGQVYTTPCAVTDSTVISYSVTIKPIVASKCAQAGCHNSAGGSANDFTYYGDTTNFVGLVAVCYGDTSGSSAWQYINGVGPGAGDQMPKPGSPLLTPCEKASIRNWIHQGASNN
jgi:hypothetical protein